MFSRPWYVGNTRSHLNTEVKQHWAWIVLEWETAWELQVLLTKNKARLQCYSFKAYMLWENLDYVPDSLLATDAKYWRSTGLLNVAQPCGALKMAKSYIEATAANQRRSGFEGYRFKTWCQQGLFAVQSPLKSTLLLWFVYTISFHALVDCTFALHVRNVTWAQ